MIYHLLDDKGQHHFLNASDVCRISTRQARNFRNKYLVSVDLHGENGRIVQESYDRVVRLEVVVDNGMCIPFVDTDVNKEKNNEQEEE